MQQHKKERRQKLVILMLGNDGNVRHFFLFLEGCCPRSQDGPGESCVSSRF
jgi:hypothetical protein